MLHIHKLSLRFVCHCLRDERCKLACAYSNIIIENMDDSDSIADPRSTDHLLSLLQAPLKEAIDIEIRILFPKVLITLIQQYVFRT